MIRTRTLGPALALLLLVGLSGTAQADGERVSLGMEEGIVSDMLSECLEMQGFVLVDRGMILPEVQARGLSLGDLFDRQDVALAIAEKLHADGVTRVVIVADVKAWHADSNPDLGYETWRARIRLLAIDGATGDEIARDQNEDKESRSGAEKARDAAITRTMRGLCESFAKELRDKLGSGPVAPPEPVETPVAAVVHGLPAQASERGDRFVDVVGSVRNLILRGASYDTASQILTVQAAWDMEYESPEQAAGDLLAQLQDPLAAAGLSEEFIRPRIEGNRVEFDYQLPLVDLNVVVDGLSPDAERERARRFVSLIESIGDYQVLGVGYDGASELLTIKGRYGGSAWNPDDRAVELLQLTDAYLERAALTEEFTNGRVEGHTVRYSYMVPLAPLAVELDNVDEQIASLRGPVFQDVVGSVPSFDEQHTALNQGVLRIEGLFQGRSVSPAGKAEELAASIKGTLQQRGLEGEFGNVRVEGALVRATYQRPATATIVVVREQPVHLLVDASKSVAARWDEVNELAGSVGTLVRNGRFGLRVYGAGKPASALDRQDTQKLHAPGSAGADRVVQALASVKPQGLSLLAHGLEAAAGDLAGSDTNVLVVISDGEETGGGDPVAAATALKRARPDLKVFIISLAQPGSEADHILRAVAAKAGGAVVYPHDHAPERVAEQVGQGGPTSYALNPVELDGPLPQDPVMASFGDRMNVYCGVYEVTIDGAGTTKVRLGPNETVTVRLRGSAVVVD